MLARRLNSMGTKVAWQPRTSLWSSEDGVESARDTRLKEKTPHPVTLSPHHRSPCQGRRRPNLDCPRAFRLLELQLDNCSAMFVLPMCIFGEPIIVPMGSSIRSGSRVQLTCRGHVLRSSVRSRSSRSRFPRIDCGLSQNSLPRHCGGGVVICHL